METTITSDFNVILHPTDFSLEADQAFQMACSIARDQSANVVVLHIVPPSTSPNSETNEELVEENSPLGLHCRDEFRRMQAIVADVPLRFRITVGYAVGMILNVARQEEADLIVIAEHCGRQFHFQIHDSVADGVFRQTLCPVLCLRQPISVAEKLPHGPHNTLVARG